MILRELQSGFVNGYEKACIVIDNNCPFNIAYIITTYLSVSLLLRATLLH